MGASERYTRDGDVVNSILFEVESLGGIDKKKIKESISLLVDSEIKKEGAGELQLTDLS
ncbi:MAG: hypothetical protein GY938_16575 [Ketobacter sp.]|nr:hypothetical protein [Ketobacter sp.]